MRSKNKNIIFTKIATTIVLIAAIFLFNAKAWAADQEMLKKEIIISDNGLIFKVLTDQKSVSEVMVDLNITLNKEDYIYPSLPEEVSNRIIIERATAVKILVDGQTVSCNTFAQNVEQTLNEMKVNLGETDELNYPLNTPIFSGMEVEVTRVKSDKITKNVIIPFETIRHEDPNLLLGKIKTTQDGEEGLSELVYKIIYKNSRETQRILEKKTILKKPQNKIMVLGTKVVTGTPSYGIASFYRYGEKLTCASTVFPFGTNLKVTNTTSGNTVIVKVNDYGPFVPGRIIDLNIPAFEKIAPLGAGVARVKVEEILN